MEMRLRILFILLCFPIILIGQNIPSYIPKKGLLLWYPFNGNAMDESGNNNNGVIIGASPTFDRNGNSNSAFSFNGENNYIEVKGLDISTDSSFTFSIWFRRDNYGQKDVGLVMLSGLKCSSKTKVGSFGLSIDKHRNLNGRFRKNDCEPNSSGILSVVAPSSNDSEWHHVTFVKDKDGLFIYVDSELKSKRGGAINSSTSFGHLTIGATPLGENAGWFFNGSLDDVGVWNRALNSKEIKGLLNQATASNSTGHSNGLSLQESQNYRIPAKFDEVGNFKEGLASVKLNGKWGFINTLGEVAIPLIYENVQEFRKGISVVIRNNKVEIIDKLGKLIVSTNYDNATPLDNGFCIVYRNRLCGLVDRQGKEIILSKYEGLSYLNENLFSFTLKEYSDYYKDYVCQKGVIDIAGRILFKLPPTPSKYGVQYCGSISVFKNGLAKVQYNNKYGFINTNGKEVIPIKYAETGNFSDGYVWVKLNSNRYIYLDKDGNQTISDYYHLASDFRDGIAKVIKIGSDAQDFRDINKFYGVGYTFFIDKMGRKVARQLGLLNKTSKNGCGCVDFSGNIKIPLIYYRCPDFVNGVAIVQQNQKYYQKVQWKEKSWLEERSTMKYGLIDINGKEIIPIKYDDLYLLKSGIAIGFYSTPEPFGSACLIDKTGKEISAFYDRILFDDNDDCDLYPVNQNGKWGCISKAGDVVVPIRYDEIKLPKESMVAVKTNGKWGFLRYK